ncbi:MAG: MurR/RpiR family transcriptional regulator, partial [Erysipelotrichaceae bacterium]|nr:MurR/RpiR family transcriptional regulator [Erysipelotrichaceae bacterium]
LEEQRKIFKTLTNRDIVIVTSIAGGFIHDCPDIMREIIKTPAYKVIITQLEDFDYSDKFDLLLKVGNDHHSLIGKFSVTYIFEVLEALYHLKYGMV